MGGVMAKIVSVKHLCSCLSHALYSAELLAMGSCCLILTGRLSQSLIGVRTSLLQRYPTPTFALGVPPHPSKGGSSVSWESNRWHALLPSPVMQVAPLPVLPPQHRKGLIHYLYCSGFRTEWALVTSKSSSSNRMSMQIKGLLAVGTTHNEKPLFPTWSLVPAVRSSSCCGEELWPLFSTLFLWPTYTFVTTLRDRRRVRLCKPG